MGGYWHALVREEWPYQEPLNARYDASQYVTEKPLFIWSVNLKAVKWNGTVVLTEKAEAGVEGDVALQSGDG